MNISKLHNDRFEVEEGFHITVQVPEQRANKIIDAVLKETPLKYGDYDSVSYKSQIGLQQFKCLGGGRNSATDSVVSVPCVELSFFTEANESTLVKILKSVYYAHPYEEPVVFVKQCARTLHVRGLDEDNPNRFWNQPTDDWVPEEHR